MTWKFRFIPSLSFGALALAVFPAAAQQAAPSPTVSTWNPSRETVIVNGLPYKQFRGVLTGTRITSEIMISASVPVPYGDLNLTRTPDVGEFTRRIHVAARMVCDQLDNKYPLSRYPVLDGSTTDDCIKIAADDGMVLANAVIASKQQR